MTCREAQERLADLFDSAPAGATAELQSHLAGCERCAAEYAVMRATARLIAPRLRIQASPDFKERVMKKLTEVETERRRWRFVPRLALVGAAAIVAVMLFVPRGGSPALSLLAQSAEAMSSLQSVHIVARMRTAPQDNFEYINPQMDWVPLEVWKEFGNPPKWRVEKPGRVAVMDGTSSLMLMRPDTAVRGGRMPGFFDWVYALLDPDKILDKELAAARAQQSTARMVEQDHQLVMAVERVAQGDFHNDWLLNNTISSSNHTRIYRFDPATKRLIGMQLILHSAVGDVPVFEITSIQYNEPMPANLFTIDLPANVSWYLPPEQMASSHALPQSPKEAAAMFFNALSRQDADALLAVYPGSAVPPWAKQLAGLQLVSLGEPFQSGKYGGWFVPYEYILNGKTKKWNLAVRNDNPAHRWFVDGGY